MSPGADLRRLLGKVFDGCRPDLRKTLSSSEYTQRKHAFVFHMTDWLDDLKSLTQLYEHPEKEDPETAATALIGFLYHVVPHLNAAGGLLLDEIVNPFEQAGEKPIAQPADVGRIVSPSNLRHPGPKRTTRTKAG